MAKTTPNYGWTVPTSGDLVKDGATAIETLGDAIDASMNTALGTKKAGMVLLNTTAFSGVTSQSFNNVFTTDYDYYKVIFTGNTASNSDLNLRMRVAGADNSSAIYNRQFIEGNNTSLAGARANSGTSMQVGGTGANVGDYDNLITIEIGRPFIATPTTFISNVLENRSGTGVLARMFTGIHATSTSFDGFTLITTSNMTASVSVFGYNK